MSSSDLLSVSTDLNRFKEDDNLLQDNYGQPQFSSHRIHWVSGTIIGLYATLCITGILANLTVIIVMLKYTVLHNITNIFVLVLAFSDILLCAFNMPLQAFYEILETVHFSTGTCQILFAFFGLPVYVSCITMLLITVDRYRIILHPLLPRMSPLCAILLVVMTFVLSMSNAIPVALFTRSNQPINATHSYCIEMWPSEGWRLIYSFVIFVIQFFLPLLVTSILSFRIYRRLEELKFRKNDVIRKKRTNKILALIVTCFAVCWSPWACYSLFCEFRIYFKSSIHSYNITSITNSSIEYNKFISSLSFPEKHTKTIDLFLKILAMGSCTINPFLYSWLNDNLRSVVRRFSQVVLKKNASDNNPNINFTPKMGVEKNLNIYRSDNDAPNSNSDPECDVITNRGAVCNHSVSLALVPLVHNDITSTINGNFESNSCVNCTASVEEKTKDSDSDLENPNISESDEELYNVEENFLHFRTVLLQNNFKRQKSLFLRSKLGQDRFLSKRKISLV